VGPGSHTTLLGRPRLINGTLHGQPSRGVDHGGCVQRPQLGDESDVLGPERLLLVRQEDLRSRLHLN